MEKEILLNKCKFIYEIFKEGGETECIKWHDKLITNEWLLIHKLIECPMTKLVGVTPEEICEIPAKYKKSKNPVYSLTDEDLDLLIEIENVLLKRSKQIWGLSHKKKIKGGGDITPYETGYSSLYAYIELLERIMEGR